jgi:hypothetical protein
MSVTQLAVFIENTPGRLLAVTRSLGAADVNIRGFSIADTEDYGILRLLVDHEAEARDVLRAHGFMIHESQVILAQVPDHPGGFAEVLETFATLNVNVEYTYATAESLIAFGVEDPARVEAVLTARGVRLMTNADLATL